MKRRVGVTTIIVIAIIVALLALRSKNRGAGSAQHSSDQPPNEQSKRESPLRDVVDMVSNPSSLIPESIKKSTQARETKEQFTRAVEGMNRPINFYGRVIDENSNALPGAKISVSVRHWDSAAPSLSGSIPLTTQSDVGGDFHLTGATGDAIGVDSVIKEGYEIEPIPGGYGATEGSPEAPIVFKMWNTNIHEQLIAESKSFHIVPDGRKYIVNLANGTIAESGEGDLKVWVKRPDSVGQRDRYDWSCGVEVIN